MDDREAFMLLENLMLRWHFEGERQLEEACGDLMALIFNKLSKEHAEAKARTMAPELVSVNEDKEKEDVGTK